MMKGYFLCMAPVLRNHIWVKCGGVELQYLNVDCFVELVEHAFS